MFTIDNWSYSCFKSSSLQVIISLGGSFDESSSEPIVEYLVTVLDEKQNETFQQNFNNLEKAVDFVNDRYGLWSFEELKANDGDGCGSCEAH
jgi:hypothetical protein